MNLKHPFKFADFYASSFLFIKEIELRSKSLQFFFVVVEIIHICDHCELEVGYFVELTHPLFDLYVLRCLLVFSHIECCLTFLKVGHPRVLKQTLGIRSLVGLSCQT